MIRVMWLLVVCALALTACKWGLPDSEKEEREKQSFLDRLQGKWETDCLFQDRIQGEDDIWFLESYEFNDSDVVRTWREYAESSCDEPDLVIRYTGKLDLGDEIEGEDGQTVRETDFTYDDIDVTDGVAEIPDTPYRRFDILYLRNNDSGFFLGEIDDTHDGTTAATRPVAVEFSIEYLSE